MLQLPSGITQSPWNIIVALVIAAVVMGIGTMLLIAFPIEHAGFIAQPQYPEAVKQDRERTSSSTRPASQNREAGTHTYTNTRYGFVFQYPADWLVRRHNTEEVLIRPTTDENVKGTQYVGSYVRVLSNPIGSGGIAIDAIGFRNKCKQTAIAVAGQDAKRIELCGFFDPDDPNGEVNPDAHLTWISFQTHDGIDVLIESFVEYYNGSNQSLDMVLSSYQFLK